MAKKKTKKEEVKKPAIESIYSVEEKKPISKGLVLGIFITIFVLIIIVLAAISMKSGSASAVKDASDNYKVSILGTFNAKTVSLPILSIVLGFIDGFNPCAMWILVFLILMLFEMKDRKRMWILGSVFLLTSALIYLVFMVSWLNVAMFLTGIKMVRYAIGIFAVIFGTVNIYRFFKLLKDDDGCDVTDSKRRSKIMTSIKKIVSEKSFIISVLGIMLLAAGVNLLELLCSLGIPVVFTQVLALNNLNVVQYMIYIILYLLFFMVDDFIVFIIAMTTFKVTGISNKYTKFSHIIGGIFMVILGVLMMFKPAWVMFNFDDNKTVIRVTDGEYIQDAKVDDIDFVDDKVNIYLFYGSTCPHCQALEEYLGKLKQSKKYSTYFNFYSFEVWNSKENQNMMLEIADIVASKDKVTGVPFLVIGEKTMVGYASYQESNVLDMILTEYKKEKKYDAFKVYKQEKSKTTTTITTTIATTTTSKKKKK